MLTNNFYQAMRAYLSQTTLNSVLKTLDNSSINCYYTMDMSANPVAVFGLKNVSTGGYGIMFGTGNVPPSVDDYKMSGDVISTISILARSAQSSFDAGGVHTTSVLTVQNTSSTDTIVINEIGFVAYTFTASSRGAYTLVDRTVLDEPLTLAPGEQGVITHMLDWSIIQ